MLSPELQDSLARLLLAILALVIIWGLRRVVLRLVLPLFRRLVRRSASDTDDVVLNAIAMPVRLLIIALAIYVAVAILSPDGTPLFVHHLCRTLVLIAIFAAIYRTVGILTRSALFLVTSTGIKIDAELLPFVRTALRVVLIAIAIVIVLQEWEYDVGGLLAGLGLGGLAFALAAQDTVSNLFGFTTIVGDRPLVVGEFIVTPDVQGTVEQVGFRSTRIRQMDQALVTIPNSKLANSVILNWSRLDKRWYNTTLGLTYSTTSAQMRALLARIEEMLKARDCVDPDSAVAFFTNFGDSALEVIVRCNILKEDWREFTSERQEINLALMDIVHELGLSFAFTSQSLYIENMPGLDALQRLLPGTPGPADEASGGE